MKCDDLLLEDYVEGFLTGVEKVALETHLNTCLKCQQTLENLKTEQRLLATALNEAPLKAYPSERVIQEIQQHKQKKAKRQRYNLLFITAAIVMISFTLLATLKQPNQLEDNPTDNHSINHTATAPEENTFDIPLNAGPVLEFNMNSVAENNGIEKITYHVKYNDIMQQYANITFEKIIDTYQIDKYDLSYGGLHGLISSAVRNRQNEVIATFDIGENESIEPIYPVESLYKQETYVVGEQLQHFSLPVEKEAETFEILSYFADIPTFTEPVLFKNNGTKTFDYLGYTYTIDDTQIIEHGLQLSIHVEGNPTIIPSKWYITLNGTNYHNVTFHKKEQSKTRITLIIPQIKAIPEEMTMLPYLGSIEEKFTPPMKLNIRNIVDK